MTQLLFEKARARAGLTQEELADRAGTSRPTISAYESGRKSPTLATAERILRVAGFDLSLEPVVQFRQVASPRGRPFFVPDRLWRLPIDTAFKTVELPLSLNWSDPGRQFAPGQRRDRALLYERLIREGTPKDMLRWVDGALLIDIWDELVVPKYVRKEWEPAIGGVTA